MHGEYIIEYYSMYYKYAYLQYQRGKSVPRAMVLYVYEKVRDDYMQVVVYTVYFFLLERLNRVAFFINIVLETGFCIQIGIYLNSSRPIRKCEFYYNENDFPYRLYAHKNVIGSRNTITMTLFIFVLIVTYIFTAIINSIIFFDMFSKHFMKYQVTIILTSTYIQLYKWQALLILPLYTCTCF